MTVRSWPCGSAITLVSHAPAKASVKLAWSFEDCILGVWGGKLSCHLSLLRPLAHAWCLWSVGFWQTRCRWFMITTGFFAPMLHRSCSSQVSTHHLFHVRRQPTGLSKSPVKLCEPPTCGDGRVGAVVHARSRSALCRVRSTIQSRLPSKISSQRCSRGLAWIHRYPMNEHRFSRR